MAGTTSTSRERTAVAVDLVILTVRQERLEILLIRRGKPPFLGQPALPGGFLEAGEDLDQAAERELVEETGVPVERLHLEQVRSYGAPDRDPRQRVVSVCYLALLPDMPLPTAGGDASAAAWVPLAEALAGELAFDHREMIEHAVERARGQLEDTTLATAFCPAEFTIAELRRIYEIVWGQQLDAGNFSRKVTGADGLLVPTGERTTRNGGRPAALYRRGPATVLYPAILRNR